MTLESNGNPIHYQFRLKCFLHCNSKLETFNTIVIHALNLDNNCWNQKTISDIEQNTLTVKYPNMFVTATTLLAVKPT